MIFQYINVCPVPREMLKTSAYGLGFQHLPRDLANVNAWNTMFDPYIDHSVFRTPSERLLLSKSYFLRLFTDFVSSCCWKLQVVNLYYQREQFTLSYEIQLVFNLCPSFLFLSFSFSFFLSFFITFIYL